LKDDLRSFDGFVARVPNFHHKGRRAARAHIVLRPFTLYNDDFQIAGRLQTLHGTANLLRLAREGRN